DLQDALSTMQDQYFSLWLGKWTTAIDWTAAVMCTYISATLSTFSQSLDTIAPKAYTETGHTKHQAQRLENEINKYFGQTVAFYFGEETFEIRMQAYDDMLWVVLEWLESIQFIKSHSSTIDQQHWHGKQYLPAFAHRARIFYELAEQGWDWRLCGGGMTWNPRLLPYKNAITNQLFISASISMYLHFPGDKIRSPFSPTTNKTTPPSHAHHQTQQDHDCANHRTQYDPIFLQNAVNGYTWLHNIGMLNTQGLYTDGFHIHDYKTNKSATTCDERNEMVYTYNQGVVLSALRGLWEATGNTTYLAHAHDLIRNVLRATGWDAEAQRGVGGEWSGLGRDGVLMEACDDAPGSCNQDAQTFKGIFFLHLTAFCAALPRRAVEVGKTFGASDGVARRHWGRCDAYVEWVVRNAEAALVTRDGEGRFGGRWG
ncbi:glycosyl hydrolase family 76-domain-containing protein, partial [Phaeosphaeriaceae sp. PMI808]